MKRIIEIDYPELLCLIFAYVEPVERNEFDYYILTCNGLEILNPDEEEFLYNCYENQSKQNKILITKIDRINNCLIPPEWITTFTIEEKYKELNNIMNDEIENFLNKMPYNMFLNHSYWFIIRDYKKHITGNKCQLCSNKIGLQVHHNSYKNKGSEYRNMDDIIVLCSKCHSTYHNKDK